MVSTLKVNTLQRQSGTTITVAESGDTINVVSGATLDINSGATLSGAALDGTDWESKSNDFTAAAGKSYFCDTTSNDIDVTLPSPIIGDTIRFLDVAGTFDTNDLTVLYGSSKIQGASANLDVSTERAGFALVYYDTNQGWLLKDK